MEPTDDTSGNAGDRLNALFTCLAVPGRRFDLGVLHDRAPDPVERTALADALASEFGDDPPDRVTEERRERARIVLYHVHLPKLEDAGLIASSDDGDAVALADHPAFRDDGIRAVVEGATSAGSASLDALFRALADDGRWDVLDALARQYHPIQLGTLAREVAPTEPVPSGALERIVASLRHVELPASGRRDSSSTTRTGGRSPTRDTRSCGFRGLTPGSVPASGGVWPTTHATRTSGPSTGVTGSSRVASRCWRGPTTNSSCRSPRPACSPRGVSPGPTGPSIGAWTSTSGRPIRPSGSSWRNAFPR